MILEDDPWDLVGKCLRGLELSPETLAQKVGHPVREIIDFLELHQFPKDLAAWVAPLGLSPRSLREMTNYPALKEPPASVYPLVTPFGHLGVNAWWLPKQGPGILIDCGSDGERLQAELEKLNASPAEIWITHGHPDHVGGLDTLLRAFPDAICRGPASLAHPDALTLKPGDRSFGLEVVDLDGHWPGAIGFLSEHFLVCGDAFFAGSIGGIPPEKWETGLQRLRALLNRLPGDCYLLPGHGPVTRVGIEREFSPFFAGLDRA